MSQPTHQENALTFANDLIQFASQLRSVLAQAQAIAEKQSSKNYAAVLQAMPTYTVNADGSIGTTDSPLDTGHPITGLNVSFYSLDVFRTNCVTDLIALLTGTAQPAQADRRVYIDLLLP